MILAIYTGISIAEKNKIEASTKEIPPVLVSDSATIYVSAITSDGISGFDLNGLPIHNVSFDIRRSTVDTIPTLEVVKKSQGKDKQQAYDLAQRINFYYQLDSNQLQLSPYFIIDKGEKFRGQEVKINLLLPDGYKVYLAKGSEKIINNIRNIQDVWDSDMPEHTWTMTKNGLNCDDCPSDIIRMDHQDDTDSNSQVKIKVTDGDESHDIVVN